MSVVVTGVGGQGVLLATRVLCLAAMKQGLPVIASESHGLSQRGGSVTSFIRFDAGANPAIGLSEASAILGLEPLEAVRVLDRASSETVIVTSMRPIKPIGTILGREIYPDVELLHREMRKVTERVLVVEAERTAISLGDPMVANVVLLGALVGAGGTPLNIHSVRTAVRELVPARHVAANLEGLDIGHGLAAQEKNLASFA